MEHRERFDPNPDQELNIENKEIWQGRKGMIPNLNQLRRIRQ